MRENLVACLDAVLPIFALAMVGYGAKRLGFLDRDDVKKMNKVFFRIFMPVMVFYNIYISDLSEAFDPKLVIYTLLCVVLCFAVGVLLAEKLEPVRTRRGVIVQGIYRSNLVVIGLPVVERLMGGDSLGPVVILTATVVPLFNLLAVIVLEYYGGEKTGPGKLALDILKNPLILGSLAGVLAVLIGLKLPAPLEALAEDMADAASPVLLFLLGAFLQLDGLRRDWKAVLWISMGRLMIVPAVTLIPAVLLGFRGVELASMIPVFASATAIASFTMAQQMGGDAELAGNVVVVSSALCSVTLFFWCFLFKSLGVI